MLELRDYQERSLQVLSEYLRLVTTLGADTAFYKMTGRPYVAVPQLPDLPYVCLRAPTGGGKTLMACHALGVATREYLSCDHSVCLWLVPSNAIREQTLNALRNPRHPYRQALAGSLRGDVTVLDLTEALYVQRGTLDGTTCVIVATLQALRVEDTDGRKVYESAGALQHHFDGAGPCLEWCELRQDGSLPYSLANVLRMRRPIIVMDEAHNARTELSFDTLARLWPSCVIEFTATPQTQHRPERQLWASNVLHHVSAAELKTADMIKLPIRLRTCTEWKEVVGAAIAAQRELENAAQHEERQTGEYIRPIVLLQAQARSSTRQTLTTEVVKTCLLSDFNIPEEQIAIATGDTRELDEVDLFDRNCPLRFIITVQALKEGWDCSFAYVLCSVADIHSSRAVEQLLGRILRMPRAQRKHRAELNYAYSFAASPHFIEAAQSIRDTLVESLGFQRMEAADFVRPVETPLLWGPGTLFHQPAVTISTDLNPQALPEATRQTVQYEAATGRLVALRSLTEQDQQALRAWCATVTDQTMVDRLADQSRGQTVAAGEVSAEPIKVPGLAIRTDDQLELFESDHFLDADWNLAQCDAGLSEAEFPSERTIGAAGEIDVSDGGQVAMTQFVAQVQEQLMLLSVEPGWTVPGLANWLDRQVSHPDIPQQYSSLFMLNVITGLMERRGLSVEQIARGKFRLRNAIESKIDDHRRAHARQAYQALLFGPGNMRLEVSPELCLSIRQETYSPNRYYEGSYQFRKHLFQTIGELDSSGQEHECAVFIDTMTQVKRWVRNLDRRPDSSFWLQTSSDKFYPDFVAELQDGRILVVESKGEHLWSNDDSREKRAVGELWAHRSGGRCIFVMPNGRDFGAITAAIGP